MEVFQKLWYNHADMQNSMESVCLCARYLSLYEQDMIMELLEKEGRILNVIIYLEILGAELILDDELQHGIDAWKRAMSLRWKDPNSLHTKEPIRNSPSVFLQTEETYTMADVDALPFNQTVLLTHAVIVAYRHLPNSTLYTESLVCLATQLIQAGRETQALELLDRAADRMYEQETDEIIIKRMILRCFREVMESRTVQLPFRHPLQFMKICTSSLQNCISAAAVTLASQQTTTCQQCHIIENLSDIFIRGLSLLLSLAESATEEEKAQLQGLVQTFLLLSHKHGYVLVFHLDALNEAPYETSVIKTLMAASQALAMEEKIDPPQHLARNRRGEGALHILGKRLSRKELIDDKIIESFLEHGADLCMRDNSGERIVDILVRRKIVTAGEVLPSLLCLAARQVAKMPSGMLPDNYALRDFVSKH